MRRINRVARRAHTVLRRKPLPRWFVPACKVGGVAMTIALVAGGVAWAQLSGLTSVLLSRMVDTTLAASASAGLVVDEIYSEGRQRTPRHQIHATLEISRGKPILAVEMQVLKERLEGLPWIRSATISRQLPDVLRINLIERRPFALWQRDDGYRLVDRDGAIIEDQDLRLFRYLPLIVGDDAPARAADLFALLSIEPDLMRRVRAATLIDGRRWNVRLVGGIDIRLPEHGTLKAWQRLARAVRERDLLDRAIIGIDLRQDDRMVLRLHPTLVGQGGGKGQGA